MKYFEPISKQSIFNKINKICTTTNKVYLNIDKIQNINSALDSYWFLAVNAASKASFDDTGQTSLPVETQDLADGTNAYKMASFTNEVLQLLKLAVLDADAEEIDLIREDFDNIEDFNELYSTDSDDRDTPAYWTKMGDYIYVRPCPDYDETGGLRAYVNRELIKLSFTTFTITVADPGVITSVAHGLSDNDGVLLVTDGALPTGLTVDSNIYYVSGKADDTFKLSLTPSSVGVTEIETTGTQSGTHKFIKVSGTPGIPVIHHKHLSKYASLEWMNPKHPNYQKTAQELRMLEEDIKDYWRTMESESNAIIYPSRRCYK